MSMSRNAALVYKFLREVVPTKKVVTYGEVRDATGVPLGQGGGAVAKALYEIFRKCDEEQLPPIASIVVNLKLDGERHGMTGGGYLSAEAESDNLSNRRRDPGWERWKARPRPDDTESWKMQDMIKEHQDAVWDYLGDWPATL